MGIILNLTQHVGTPEQGVFEPADKAEVSRLLTFDTIPTQEEMGARAKALAAIARDAGAEYAMIGGAPFFMAPLEAALRRRAVLPLYAFSIRESVEETLPNGEVRKTQIFRHLGFVATKMFVLQTSLFEENEFLIGYRFPVGDLPYGS